MLKRLKSVSMLLFLGTFSAQFENLGELVKMAIFDA